MGLSLSKWLQNQQVLEKIAREKWLALLESIMLTGAMTPPPAIESSGEQVATKDAFQMIGDREYVPLFAGLGQGIAVTAWRAHAVTMYLSKVLMEAWSPSVNSDSRDAVNSFTCQDQNLHEVLTLKTKFGGEMVFRSAGAIKMHFVGHLSCSVTALDDKRLFNMLDAGSFILDGIVHYLYISPPPSFLDVQAALCVPAWCIKKTSNPNKVIIRRTILDVGSVVRRMNNKSVGDPTHPG